MKKIVAGIILASMLMVTLAGCGSKDGFDTKRAVNAITREDGSGTRGAFVELFELEEKLEDGSKRDLISKDIGVENNTNTILTTVKEDTYAIGYISMGSLNEEVKAVQIDGTEASADNVKSGDYKISRPFAIATKSDPSEVAKDFIDFILSKEGEEVIADSYIAITDNAEGYAGDKPSGTITVGGSSSVSPLMEKLIERYKEVNPNASVELQISDSSIGMTQTIDGAYDIGMASRALKDSEKEELEDTQIALDGIAVIVNLENEVSGLSQDEIRRIYLGEVEAWSDIIE